MRPRMLLAAVATIVASSTMPSAQALPGTTARISLSSRDAQANGDTPASSVPDRTSPAMSLDGRWVAFSSDATNLVPGDTNRAADVFVRDLLTGSTRRASLTHDGRQAGGASYSPAMSVDGRWLAYVSRADDIVPGDTNGAADVFLRDMSTGSTRRISVGDGVQANGDSNRPFVSLFGEWVTFESEASNLAPGDDNALADAFVYDRRARSVIRIAPPAPPTDWSTPLVAWTHSATISYEGRWISYVAAAKRVRPEAIGTAVPEETQLSDLYLLNTRTGKRIRVRWPLRDGRYRNFADDPYISADGKRIVFVAWSVLDPDGLWTYVDRKQGSPLDPDVIARNPLDPKDILLYDRPSRTVSPVSRNSYGLMGDGDSVDPTISSEGHVITFASDATNLVSSDTNGVRDVFVVDMRERATSRTSLTSSAAQVSVASDRPSMSYDGRSVVFASAASGLVTGDTNGAVDVFLRDRQTLTINRPPRLTNPILFLPEEGPRGGEEITVNIGDQVTLQLRARDPDDDPLGFGIIVAAPPNITADPAGQVPDGMALDPATGRFTWTPLPTQVGPWGIVFWVADPRGFGHIGLARYVVRDAPATALCIASAQC